MQIEKALAIIEEQSYEISNLGEFSQIYFFLNAIKKRATELETKVKKKGKDLMLHDDIKSLEFNDSIIMRIDPGESEEHNPVAVIETLGMERAIAFIKIDSSISDYLKKASQRGIITMEEVEGCRKGIKKKRRSGYMKIMPKKS